MIYHRVTPALAVTVLLSACAHQPPQSTLTQCQPLPVSFADRKKVGWPSDFRVQACVEKHRNGCKRLVYSGIGSPEEGRGVDVGYDSRSRDFDAYARWVCPAGVPAPHDHEEQEQEQEQGMMLSWQTESYSELTEP